MTRQNRFNWRSMIRFRQHPNLFLELPEAQRHQVIVRAFLFMLFAPWVFWGVLWLKNWLWP